MEIIENIFGFEIEQQPFTWNNDRPTPPKKYIKFNSRMAKCPNCGTEKPGIGRGKRNSGFKDRQIQNLWRALGRTNEKLALDHPNWKPSFELFSIDLIPEKRETSTMLKCHPSRYGTGKFLCCGAAIWHDLYGDDWTYFYKRTKKNNNTLYRWF